MKYGNVRLFRPAVLFAATTLCLNNPSIGHAQSLAMRAKVPFAFYVGAVRLPAGAYLMERVGTTGDVLRVSDDSGSSVVILTNASFCGDAGVTGELVFNRYADTFFLSEVRWSEFRIARTLLHSRVEREFARNGQPRRTAVAAVR